VRETRAPPRLVERGEKVIVASFASYDASELEAYDPVVVHVDEANRPARVDSHAGLLMGSPLAAEVTA